MSISTQTLQTLNAAFKVQYADKMKDLIPEMAPLMSKVPFVSAAQKNGAAYVQPVLLSLDHGFTCHGSNDQVLNLNPPVGHQIQQANITASAYSGRSFLSSTAISRATGDKQSFIDATGHIVQSLSKSFTHMMEGTHWYGGTGLATVTAATAALAVNAVEIAAGAAAAFLWLGGEGMPVDIYDSTSTSLVLSTEVTKVKVGQAYDDTSADKITLVLASVSGLSNGTSYVIYRKGFNGLEGAGLKKILTTDSIFGINGANYGLWKANRYTASAALSFSVLSTAIARSIGRGLTGPLLGYVNPRAFRSLMPDYASLGDQGTTVKARNAMSAAEAKALVHGTKSVNIIVDSVEVAIESTEFVKGGDAFLLSKEDLIRVGSAAPTFSVPGMDAGAYFFSRPDTAAAELRIWADEAVFSEAMNKHLIIQSITV